MNRQLSEEDILRGFDEQWRKLLLNARPKAHHAETGTVSGKAYELLLLRGEYIVSAPAEGREHITGARLSEALPMNAQTVEQLRRYLAEPKYEMMAFSLLEQDRLALIAPLLEMKSGESIGFVLGTDIASTARVLARSFGRAVALDAELLRLSKTPMREIDEQTYLLLCRLLRMWRCLVSGKDIRIHDRRELSRQLRLTGELVLALLGDRHEDMGEIFPLVYPFAGVYRSVPAAWMMLCLGCGVFRVFSSLLPDMHFGPERERLLPMMELPVGNRTVLPPEWQECGRLAKQYGMLFEVKRRRNAVRVVLCPMTPDIEPAKFFAMRASRMLHARLRASLARHAFGCSSPDSSDDPRFSG